eukprot:5982161-Karenia_brevis.AAC.1
MRPPGFQGMMPRVPIETRPPIGAPREVEHVSDRIARELEPPRERGRKSRPVEDSHENERAEESRPDRSAPSSSSRAE